VCGYQTSTGGRQTDRAAEARRAEPDLGRERGPEGADLGNADQLKLELKGEGKAAGGQRYDRCREITSTTHLPAGLKMEDLGVPGVPAKYSRRGGRSAG
jgi:hypothetical protein